MQSTRARPVTSPLAPVLVGLAGLLLAACVGHPRERTTAPDEVRWCSVEDEAAGRCVARLMPEPVFTAQANRPAARLTASARSR